MSEAEVHNLSAIVSLVSVIAMLIVAWWNNQSGKKRLPAQNSLDNTKSLESANTAIERAFARADAAEKEWENERRARLDDRLEFDKKHAENKTKIDHLEAAFEDYKKKHNRYMVAFTMKFTDDDPVIEYVKGYRDRREPHTQPYPGEERRGKE